MTYTLTERVSGKVGHSRFDELDAALDALERRGHELQGRADARTVLRYAPENQVFARLELSGVKAGVDIRGDGSAVPFTGRLRRRAVEREEGETAYAALRRVIALR